MAVDALTLNLLQNISKGVESSKEENRNAFSYITNLLTSSNKKEAQFDNSPAKPYGEPTVSLLSSIKEQNRILKDQYNIIKKYVDFKTKPDQFEKERENTRGIIKQNNETSKDRQKDVHKKDSGANWDSLVSSILKNLLFAGALTAIAASPLGRLPILTNFNKIESSRAQARANKTIKQLESQKVKPKGSTPQVEASKDLNKKIDSQIAAAQKTASIWERSPILKALKENKIVGPFFQKIQSLGPVLQNLGSRIGGLFTNAVGFAQKIPGLGKAIGMMGPALLKLGRFAGPAGIAVTVLTEGYQAFKLFKKTGSERKKYLKELEDDITNKGFIGRALSPFFNTFNTGAVVVNANAEIYKSAFGYIKNWNQARKMQLTLEEKLLAKEKERAENKEQRLQELSALGDLTETGVADKTWTNAEGEQESIDSVGSFNQWLSTPEGRKYMEKKALEMGVSKADARAALVEEYKEGKISDLPGQASENTSIESSSLAKPENIPDEIREFYENAPAGAAFKTDPDYEEKTAAWEAWKARDAEITAEFKEKGFEPPKKFIKRKPGSDANYTDWKQVQETSQVKPAANNNEEFVKAVNSFKDKVDELKSQAANNVVSVSNQSVTAPTPSYGERYRSSSATINAGADF